jgi:ABC-type ATPase with predicted acetyltransferase domain
MIGQLQTKTHRFKYYLRECKKCGEIFKSNTKKCKVCNKCKPIINKERIRNSLISRGIVITKLEIKNIRRKNVTTKFNL